MSDESCFFDMWINLRRTIRESNFLRRFIIGVWHLVGISLTYYLSFLIRFEGRIPFDMQVVCFETFPLLLISFFFVFSAFRLYSGFWSYFSIDDLVRMATAIFTGLLVFGGMVFVSGGYSFKDYPRSVFILEFLLLGLWMGGGRLCVRYYKKYRRGDISEDCSVKDRIIIVGLLMDADVVIRGLQGCVAEEVVGVISSDPDHHKRRIHGVKVSYSELTEVGAIVEMARANCVLILPPFNRPRQMEEIVESCIEKKLGCSFRTIPTMMDLASGNLAVSSIRNIDIEDLLSRDEVRFDRKEVRSFLKNKKVMITGAGGSIGSELCKQIATYEPSLLVLFEFSEYALYLIDRTLREQYPSLRIIPCAGDVRHSEEVRAAIDAVDGIDVIYHAAAYKHVPLMEQNVSACFRTNVLGTMRLAEVAVQCKVDRFVMISSDKAVNPTSVMGATKRIAERIINEVPQGKTTFVSVRFGNVLESSGSVVPLFKKQIAEGGPVTVTSPDIRRYFMTISEAVDLVLMAGTVGLNNEIMVLEMGYLMKVNDLARRLIELSGLVPDQDIEIKYIGLRPGEKEYEEIMTDDEHVVQTPYEKIWRFEKNGNDLSALNVSRIEKLVLKNDTKSLRKLAAEYVPENCFPESVL